MQQLSLRTGVVSYTAAIDACGCASQWQKAVFLLAQLQSMPNDFPNLMTYTAVAAATGSCFAAGFFPLNFAGKRSPRV
jgi:pentatricopeptide repeat protein